MERAKSSLLLFVSILLLSCSGGGPEQLAIGEKMPHPDRKMKGIDEEKHSLKELAAENGLMVIFTCNTCPFVEAWVDRYPLVKKEARERGVSTVLLNSNAEKRKDGDALKDMVKFGEEYHPDIPYLLDEKSKTANAFGAKTTPHVFLFNEDLRLVYRGAIDDNYEDAEKVEDFYVKDALKAMVGGGEVDPATTEAKGCSIKRP
jgi:hypothetical protein